MEAASKVRVQTPQALSRAQYWTLLISRMLKIGRVLGSGSLKAVVEHLAHLSISLSLFPVSCGSMFHLASVGVSALSTDSRGNRWQWSSNVFTYLET